MYGQGVGSGGGGGSAKISVDFTNVEDIIISYVSGTYCPIIQIYSAEGDKVNPEDIHYNLSDQIKITLGQEYTG